MSVIPIWGTLREMDALRDEMGDPEQTGITPRLGRAFCDAYASNPGTSKFPPYFCGPYWDSNGDTGPVEQLPFTGGQCATLYRVRAGAAPGANPSLRGDPILGPITAFSFSPTSQAPLGGGSSGANAVPLIVTFSGTGANGPFSFQSNFSTSFSARTVSAVLERADGQPDNCGNPLPTIGPDPTYSNPRPVGEPTNVNIEGDTIPVTINGPSVDLSGDDYWTVDAPDLNITLAIPVDGPSPPSLPAEPDPPSESGDPVEPTDPAGEVDDDLPPEEEEEGFETIGYRWQLLGTPSGFSKIPGTDPVVFATTVGNVQLKLKNEGGATFYSDALRLNVQDGSLIRSDSALKVTGVRYNHLPDFQGIRLTPIRARKRNGS